MAIPARKLAWDDMPWERVREGVERKLCPGEQATVAMHRISATAHTAIHAHSQEQIVYVVSGRLRYDVGGDFHMLETGDILVIPSDVAHRSQTVGDEPAVTIDVFAPKRDY